MIYQAPVLYVPKCTGFFMCAGHDFCNTLQKNIIEINNKKFFINFAERIRG